MQIELMKSLLEYSADRAKKEFDLGDTLDVKTGLILAALTFLAIQSGDFIKEGHMPIQQVVAQAISVLAMIVGGGLCGFELWPRDYDREPQPIKYKAWIEETAAGMAEHPEWRPVTPEALISARLNSAISSVDTNLKINKEKSTFMFVAFGCALVAFAANIVTLAMRLF